MRLKMRNVWLRKHSKTQYLLPNFKPEQQQPTLFIIFLAIDFQQTWIYWTFMQEVKAAIWCI